jgi:hypothetical protein
VIWLTWRQLRLPAAVVGAGVLAVAAVLALTGARVASLADAGGARLVERLGAGGSDATIFTLGTAAVLALPAIVGAFWGAPLVARELETGTHRLVWNQTVPRSRWLATKVGIGGLAAMAAAAVLTLAVTWWAGPIDTAIQSGPAGEGLADRSRIAPLGFVSRGIAPIGYAAFAFALGVTAGLVLRRTVPAMAVTLAVLVVVHVAMPPLVRSGLGPTERTTAITADTIRGLVITGASPGGPVQELTVQVPSPGAWVVRNETVDADGRDAGTLPGWVAQCAPEHAHDPQGSGEPGSEGPRAAQDACFARLSSLGYRQQVAFQPAGRYWTLQAYETALLIALALGLVAFSSWWLRHRLS